MGVQTMLYFVKDVGLLDILTLTFYCFDLGCAYALDPGRYNIPTGARAAQACLVIGQKGS